MAALAARLGKCDQWPRALDIAHRLKSEDDFWFVQALVGVAPSVPEPERLGVAHEMWSVAHKMWSAAQTIEAQVFLSREIAKVAPFLSEPLLQDAMAFAKSIPHADRSADTLAALLPQLAKLRHFQEAFDIALTMSDSAPAFGESRMSRTLATLIPLLPEPLQSRACFEALRAAHRIDDCDDRMRTLGALAAFLSEADLRYVLESIRKISGSVQVRVLEDIAPALPDLLLPDALAVAREMSLTERAFRQIMTSPRADALLALAHRLPEPMRSAARQQAAKAFQEAREAVGSVGAGHGRLVAGAALVPHVRSSVIDTVTNDMRDSDEQRSNRVRSTIERISTGHFSESELSHILRNALSSAEKIQDPAKRAASMSLLAKHFSTLLQRQKSEREDEWNWEEFQTRALESLGQLLASEQLPAALDIALNLSDMISNRSSALKALAPRLEQLPPADAYALWRTALRGVSTGLRPDLFHNLLTLLPVILKLGGSTAVSQMASAIKVTGDWWP